MITGSGTTEWVDEVEDCASGVAGSGLDLDGRGKALITGSPDPGLTKGLAKSLPASEEKLRSGRIPFLPTLKALVNLGTAFLEAGSLESVFEVVDCSGSGSS